LKNGCHVMHDGYLGKIKGNMVKKQREMKSILQKNTKKLC